MRFYTDHWHSDRLACQAPSGKLLFASWFLNLLQTRTCVERVLRTFANVLQRKHAWLGSMFALKTRSTPNDCLSLFGSDAFVLGQSLFWLVFRLFSKLSNLLQCEFSFFNANIHSKARLSPEVVQLFFNCKFGIAGLAKFYSYLFSTLQIVKLKRHSTIASDSLLA